ncbi:hypothetical protein P7C71_g2426, partial [Lecanoromycetidae sp. Uapishka_2]
MENIPPSYEVAIARNPWGLIAPYIPSVELCALNRIRNVNLRDEDIETLAEAISVRVRSLDVQGNNLTDHSVRTLLGSCFVAEDNTDEDSPRRLHSSSNVIVDDWPAGFVRPDPAVLDEFKDESYDERFVRRLTSGIVSRLPYEDFPNSGITHLYIADNSLTVEGVAALVQSRKLYVLDAGTVDTGKIVNRPRSESSPSLSPFDARHIKFPGAEKLIPTLSTCAHEMTSLRVHHAVITEIAPPKEENPSIATCELDTEDTARQELEGPLLAELDAAVHEMDAEPPLYELDLNEPQPRYELPGDTTHFILSPPIGKKPALSKEESQPEARGGGAFAPEVVDEREGTPDDDPLPVLTATGLGSMAQTVNGINNSGSLKPLGAPAKASDMGEGTVELRRGLIEQQRRELRSSRLDIPHGLIPGMMPKLRTITLTDVPCHVKSRHAVEALIQFTKDCASEAELANLQARLEPSQSRKPGQRQATHHRHNAREIFALQHIVLEMVPSAFTATPHSAKSSKWTTNRTKSSTEDADSEAFWSAAENDFTFFDDDEECGLPSIDTESFVPYSAISEKMIMPISENSSPVDKLPTLQWPRKAKKDTLIDVVQELSKFRKERKAAFEEAKKRGVQHVDGYWPGEVKVVRGHHSGGNTDYYGNYFERGGLYR